MKILWFTWKDRAHPLAGGAETVNQELAKRLVADGHQVTFIVSGFRGGEPTTTVDGYTIIRVGGRWTVYWQAYRYYKKHLKDWPDLVIDEVNTIPFFTKFYVKQKNILFVHQLCRQIWFYELWWPLNLIGYLLEPLYLRMLNDRTVITVSESTKKDLMKYGYRHENIHIISEGIDIKPVTDLTTIKKYDQPTILSFGAIKSMKRTGHIVRAFELAKLSIPDLRLIVAGNAEGKFGKKVLAMIAASRFSTDIQYLRKVSTEKKVALMQQAHVLVVTSVKEGWGLVVTEANSQGTPAIVYDVDGLRDSVQDNETGLLCEKNTPEYVASNIVKILHDTTEYERLRRNGWGWSQTINFDSGVNELKSIL